MSESSAQEQPASGPSPGKSAMVPRKKLEAQLAKLSAQLAKAEVHAAYQELRIETLTNTHQKDLAAARKRAEELSDELLKLTADLSSYLDARRAGPPLPPLKTWLVSAVHKARGLWRSFRQRPAAGTK